jgi:uncharacterized membrane protein HdeD (DUF308 family)
MDAYNFNKTARWTFCTAGVVFVLLGILTLTRPLFVLSSVAVSMGVGFLFTGANSLVPYFSMRNNPLRPGWLLPLGVIDLIFGLLFLSRIGPAILAFTTLLGAWTLLAGFLRVWISLRVKSSGAKKWWVMLMSAFLMLALSAALLSFPRAEGVLLELLAGGSLIAVGVLMITEGRMIYPADRNK